MIARTQNFWLAGRCIGGLNIDIVTGFCATCAHYYDIYGDGAVFK